MPPRSHGARRGGSRIREPHVSVDLRRVSVVAERRRRAGHARAGTRRARRHGAHLDDDAVDDSGKPGDRVSSGLRVRRLRIRGPGGHRRDRAGREGCGSDRAAVRARGSQRSRDACSTASSSGIRSTNATPWAWSATTSRWNRARALCTPRPAMARTTSRSASGTDSKIYAPIGTNGRFGPDVGDRRRPEGLRGESGGRSRTRRSEGGCGIEVTSSTPILTAGAVTRP